VYRTSSKLTLFLLPSHRYRSAFLLCRRHRIDLNLLYDHSPSTFQAHLSEFVTQVKENDHLNLFLSGLKDEDVGRTMYRGLMGASGESARERCVDDILLLLLPFVTRTIERELIEILLVETATSPTRSTPSATSSVVNSKVATSFTTPTRSSPLTSASVLLHTRTP
jgi:hypothetical protein